MRHLIRITLSTLLLFVSLYAMNSLAAETKQADKAVAEYVRLRREGKRHHEALAKVRSEFDVTDEQINQAANQIGSAGYPTDIALPEPPLDRVPDAVNRIRPARPQ
jgi:hypothetical protein